MERAISRRTFVERAGIGAGALILGGVAVDAQARHIRKSSYVPLARTGSFPEGVAAGEPATGGITLWTRLGGFQRDRKLFVEISKDADFRSVLYRRNVVARADSDHTLNVRVTKGLRPGEQYFYRFETRTVDSPVGRFRTARPADSREPVRLAFFSCQDYQAGHYGAHTAIAAEDLDLVVCLGDYTYEKNFYAGPRRDTLGANGDGEVQTLDEYRAKYKLYRSDADLRAMHQAHAFIATWDDHEVEDNYARDLPGDAAGSRRVPFTQRRENGYRAYFEYMPFYRASTPSFLIYRRLQLGRTVDLLMLDQRRYRDDQPCGDELFTPCPDADAPGRTFLGLEQKEWLKRELERSQATWKVVGNQLMIMSLDTAPGQPINKDSWDGYGAERREILSHVEQKGIRDLTFITGDIHTFFAGDVGIDGRGPESVATEFVGGSLTSLGIAETVQGTSRGAITREQASFLVDPRVTNPHLKFQDQSNRGYALLEAREDELRVQFKGVEAATRRSTDARVLANFRVGRGDPRVRQT